MAQRKCIKCQKDKEYISDNFYLDMKGDVCRQCVREMTDAQVRSVKVGQFEQQVIKESDSQRTVKFTEIEKEILNALLIDKIGEFEYGIITNKNLTDIRRLNMTVDLKNMKAIMEKIKQ